MQESRVRMIYKNLRLKVRPETLLSMQLEIAVIVISFAPIVIFYRQFN